MTENKKKKITLNHPWENNDNPIWLATTMRLQRNIDGFCFPSKLSLEKKKQLISVLRKNLLTEEFKNPQVLKAEETTPTEKELLFEHFLFPHSFHQAHNGEAFVIDDSGLFLATLNIRDHIQLQLTDCSGDIEKSWNLLSKIEGKLGLSVNFSFSSKFGFLTSDPTECGTGMVFTVFMQLPALIQSGTIDEFLISHHDEAISVTGMLGKPKEMVGDILAVRNNYTLGFAEENLISTLRNFSTKLLVQEKSMRSTIKKEKNAVLMDKVSRAYGILTYSYQIGVTEALDAISLLKLGIDLGWISGLSMNVLNRLFFNCRRAHLLCQSEEEISQEMLPHLRAEFIHKTIKGAKLEI